MSWTRVAASTDAELPKARGSIQVHDDPSVNMQNIRLILSTVLLAVVFAFALQNVATVEVKFLFWSASLPRSLLLFFVLAVGVIVGWVLRGVMHRAR